MKWQDKAALGGLGVLLALCFFAVPMIVMGSAMGLVPFLETLGGFGFPLLACLALAAVAWIALALQWRILLGTQFAKDNGFTVADFKSRQPLSRGDYLARIIHAVRPI